MKRLLAFIIFAAYLFSANACFALNQLYYLENANKASIASKIEALLTEKEYNIQKKDPFYAFSAENAGNKVIIILQQSGNSLYYYFETNNKKETSFNKAFLKKLDKQNITYYEYFDENYIKSFAETAQSLVTGTQKTYSFDNNTQSTVYFQETPKVQEVNNNVLKGYVASVGGGTSLDAYLQSAVNTATAAEGDSIIAVLKSNWTTNDNRVIAPQGSLIYGNVIKASSAKAGMRNGKVSIDFNKLALPDGRTYELSTQSIDFNVTNEGSVKTSVSKVAVASALGALAGLAFAAMAGNNLGSAAAIGAGVGGGLALVGTAAQKGVDAEIPSFTEVEINVLQDINVIFNY